MKTKNDLLFKEEICKHWVDENNVLIRGKNTEEGLIPDHKWGSDAAHVWIDGQMYRITKKGTIIKVIRRHRYGSQKNL